MAAHVFKRDNLAGRIATYLLAISPGTTVALALTCRDLEVPTLRVLWEKEDTLIFLIKRVLPTDIQYYVYPPHTDHRSLVGPPLLSDRRSAYSSIVKNAIVAAATTYLAGDGQTQEVRLVDGRTRCARVGSLGGNHSTLASFVR